MQINKRQLKKWIAALDSGKYKQGHLKLNPSGNTYCCLGVACRVIIADDKLVKDGDRISGGLPDCQPWAPEWLMNINEDFRDMVGVEISVLNDDHGFTFPEIATILELVYIHKILD